MEMNWILGWWNVIFIVPFLLALLYLGLYTVSGWTFGESDLDADSDVDADGDLHPELDAHADVDADADADIHADIEAEVEAAADHEHDAEHDSDSDHGRGSTFFGALAWFGVGRVPLSMVLMILMLSWGLIGFATNQMIRGMLPQDWMVSLASLPLAFIGSMLCTRAVSGVVGRLLPTTETYARCRGELVGERGETIFDVNDRFGMAWVCDRRGERRQVACRVEEGRAPVPKGSQVLLVGYDEKERTFYVRPAPAAPRDGMLAGPLTGGQEKL